MMLMDQTPLYLGDKYNSCALTHVKYKVFLFVIILRRQHSFFTVHFLTIASKNLGLIE
jgi:hypothetical protein